MKAQYGNPSRQVTLVSAKAAYSKAGINKLIDSRAKLDSVKTAVQHSIMTGRLHSSSQLESALRAIETRLATAETRLEALRKSSEQDWDEFRDQLENAWEDLAHSTSKLVARIKDETR